MNKTSSAPDSPFFSPAADAISNTEATARLMGEWYPGTLQRRREQAKVILQNVGMLWEVQRRSHICWPVTDSAPNSSPMRAQPTSKQSFTVGF